MLRCMTALTMCPSLEYRELVDSLEVVAASGQGTRPSQPGGVWDKVKNLPHVCYMQCERCLLLCIVKYAYCVTQPTQDTIYKPT